MNDQGFTPPVSQLISVVVPCYNEEPVLEETMRHLQYLAADLSLRYRFEFIFVDDGSGDRTLEILREAANRYSNIKIVSFARNFGHQIAVTAGIDATSGDAVALIDADLQDPPEVLAEMLERWQSGYEVVYGVRASREGESAFKIATARWFYRVLNRLSERPIPLDTGDFRLMDRKVVDALRSMPERHRFVRGLVAWIGYRQIALPYDRKKRAAGTSKYPLRKMLRFATDGILSFSSKPLQIATNLGVLAALLALTGIIYAIVLRVTTSIWVEGWTAMMIAVLFMGGVQLISLGIIGEYVGRIYEEAKGRPLYIVRERIGFEAPVKASSRERVDA
ncbi:glycosyltransferase family 2 protein [Salipiger sp. PrR002]|uniref:glycosyltransferase family 2 protein n=1 Tax=Salipiger sp. PrR002 TaxID=2706489 RepID=UPI0013B8CA4B|nr:glycosyltransferase family 2 protein [Salipiger sp. PrR002]NDW02425.1 glycosyltransferase family 2 protein [Salipiger sp. PrR002]NDW59554.1 glycosyltransferase family 2 protein [Salipiger sp. PrR004]